MFKLVAEIFCRRLIHNVQSTLERIPRGIEVIGVIKSDAYGHGSVWAARELVKTGISHLAVSDVWEGVELRTAGLECPILVLSDPPLQEACKVVEFNLSCAISKWETAEQLVAACKKIKNTVKVHLNVDTGMGRFGSLPREALGLIKQLWLRKELYVEGIFTHLSTVYREDEASAAYALRQISVFASLLEEIAQHGPLPPLVHVGNSPALTAMAEAVLSTPFNCLRLGTLFFGFAERPCEWSKVLIPVAEVKTFVSFLKRVAKGQYVSYDRLYRAKRDALLAVLPMGYGDGLHRHLSNKGRVLVNGCYLPIVGKICLGQTIIDASAAPGISVGDEVILAGEQLSAFEEGRRNGLGTWEYLLPLLQHSSKEYVD